MTQQKLKIGDEVCIKIHQRFGNKFRYEFDTIERFTKTQIVLKSGIKLINEESKDYIGNLCFSQYRDRYTKWYIATKEHHLEHEKEQNRQKISNWFDSKKFTDEEKLNVYNLLKGND